MSRELTKNGGTKNSRVIWQCMRAIKYGKKECPKCKAIDESIIEGAFVDAYKLLINNCDDVINIEQSNDVRNYIR